jgi:Protein of unknown function (DUF3187)
MVRTYGPLWRVVKCAALVLLAPVRASLSQGLPEFAPVNPMAGSRTGLYFQPYHEPAPGRWVSNVQLDYASVIEYNELPSGSYILDSEILQLRFGVSRDVGRSAFVSVTGSAQGSYAGFLDGFLDWYHGAFGITMIERDRRPRDRFRYSMTLPDGTSLARTSSTLFLGDMRMGLGVRLNRSAQTVLSLTLPTSTGPAGYGRGVPSVAVLTTLRASREQRLGYEGSVGLGYTPAHGDMADLQRTTFLALSSGFRYRVWGSQSLFANLFYHSPYYRATGLPALDRRDLSLDFGWILQTGAGGEWRVGLTEDLEPAGPGVDLVVRLGRTF